MYIYFLFLGKKPKVSFLPLQEAKLERTPQNCAKVLPELFPLLRVPIML